MYVCMYGYRTAIIANISCGCGIAASVVPNKCIVLHSLLTAVSREATWAQDRSSSTKQMYSAALPTHCSE